MSNDLKPVSYENIEVGKWYWVSRQGPMLCILTRGDICTRKAIEMRTPDGYNYWTDPANLNVLELDLLKFYISQIERCDVDVPERLTRLVEELGEH